MILKKNILLLYSINWPNFIVSLPLLGKILGNMCIVTVCKPGSDVTASDLLLILDGKEGGYILLFLPLLTD